MVGDADSSLADCGVAHVKEESYDESVWLSALPKKCWQPRPGVESQSGLPALELYQLLRRKPPPPPPERSVLGRASLMLRALPSTVTPFRAAIAFSPSLSLSISTNPKPLGCPESRSVQMLTRPTVPWGSNSERTVSSVAPKLRLPT